MKAKYSYHNTELRCRLRYLVDQEKFQLKLQKRKLFLWYNITGMEVRVSEGQCGENSIMCTDFFNQIHYGNCSELYKEGTLNIRDRITKLFKEYLDTLETQSKNIKKFSQIQL